MPDIILTVRSMRPASGLSHNVFKNLPEALHRIPDGIAFLLIIETGKL
ncbi:MAG: hypothetical protein VB050_12670 [Geobacteraceae bacterium]|nr:hypothetical protein [Geobacteraceae bacterium]